MTDVFRCSTASLARDEPMVGTASTVRSWLLLEHAGPWGVDAFADARLPHGFGPELAERCRAARVRPLLIRRVGTAPGSPEAGLTAFAIRSGPDPPWIERTTLAHAREALALDLQALGRGERLGLATHDREVFLVCTHGRHDPCCAERGRPLAQALANAYPDQTWECSHIGGDRFAGNLVAFPHGLYFGRVGSEGAADVVERYLEGRIDLDRFRGRSCRPMVAQAAEHALRLAEGLDSVDDLALERLGWTGPHASVTFSTRRGSFRVQVSVHASPPRPITCRGERPHAVPVYRVEAITSG